MVVVMWLAEYCWQVEPGMKAQGAQGCVSGGALSYCASHSISYCFCFLSSQFLSIM